MASKGCFLEQFKEGDNSIPSKRVKSYVQPSQSEVPARILAEFTLDPRNRFSLEFLLFMNVYTSFSPKCVCVYYTIFCSSLDMSDSPGFYLVQSVQDRAFGNNSNKRNVKVRLGKSSVEREWRKSKRKIERDRVEILLKIADFRKIRGRAVVKQNTFRFSLSIAHG